MNTQDFLTQYIKRGVPVFPLHRATNGVCSCSKEKDCSSPGKHPRTQHGFKDATTDSSQIQRWLKRFSHANWGIQTGSQSGLIVVDIDGKNDGYASLEKLSQKPWPKAPVVKTGNGEHRYFKIPDEYNLSSSTNLYKGIDIRAEGGYIVAPPSIHVNSKVYEWDSQLNLFNTPLPELPDWLLNQILQKNEVGIPKESIDRQKRNWVEHTSKIYNEGERNMGILKICAYLIGKEVNCKVVLNLIDSFNKTNCDPPLSQSEVFEILKWTVEKNSINGREQ